MGVAPVPLPEQYAAELRRSDGRVLRVCKDGGFRRVEELTEVPRRIVLTRPDQNCMYVIYPERQAYVRNRLPRGVLSDHMMPSATLAWTAAGRETVEGVECSKFHLLDGDGGRIVEIVWVDVASGMWKRSTTYGKDRRVGLTIDYLDVILGPPDRTCFDVPSGYRQVSA